MCLALLSGSLGVFQRRKWGQMEAALDWDPLPLSPPRVDYSWKRKGLRKGG